MEAVLRVTGDGGGTYVADDDNFIGALTGTAGMDGVSCGNVKARIELDRFGSGTTTFTDFDAVRLDGSNGGITIDTIEATVKQIIFPNLTITTPAALGLMKPDFLGNTIVVVQGALNFVASQSPSPYTGNAIRQRLGASGSGNNTLFTGTGALNKSEFTLDEDAQVTVSRTNHGTI